MTTVEIKKVISEYNDLVSLTEKRFEIMSKNDDYYNELLFYTSFEFNGDFIDVSCCIDEDEYKEFKIPIYYLTVDDENILEYITEQIEKRRENKEYKEYLRLKQKFEKC